MIKLLIEVKSIFMREGSNERSLQEEGLETSRCMPINYIVCPIFCHAHVGQKM